MRNAGDIVRLISDYVPLKSAGTRMKGLCPFHQEKTPSFSVDPNLQLFYCFGCQTGGDLFKFVMLYEKLSFGEAVEMLARRWGVALPAPTKQKGADALERLAALNQAAQSFYRMRLEEPQAGERCRSYLARRRIDAETSARLGLGYAPDAWDALSKQLAAKRHSIEEMLRGGLVLARKSGDGHYDRFRDRLIFPIRDLNGRTVAFGGRSLGDAEPKYINSPETPVYTKGDHLYGLDLAREAIRRESFAIVVEGYLDLAALVQAGFHNVVASLGTAFTPAQARLLARYTGRVVFSYDGDAAGSAATARSLGLLLEKGFEVRVVELPGGMDPDDFIGQNGPAAYGELLRTAPHYLQFLVQVEARTRDLTRIEEKVAALNVLLPHLAKLSGSVERAAWAARVADTLRIEDGLVLQELRSALRTGRTRIRQRPESTRALRDAECRLVHRLLASEEERRRWAAELDEADLADSRVLPIVRAILDLTRENGNVDYPSVAARLSDEAEAELLTRIAFREEPDAGPSVEDCLWAFKMRRLNHERHELVREIGGLQEGSTAVEPTADVDRHLMRLQQLARQRDALS